MHKYSEIEASIKEMNEQKPIYKPSAFWEKASDEIIFEIEKFGVENFKHLETPLGFFVPTYGIPANSFTHDIKEKLTDVLQKNNASPKQKKALSDFLDGYNHALSDYRVFEGSDNKDAKPYLHTFSESEYGKPKEHFEFDGKKYSRSSLNYILGLIMLKKHMKNKPFSTVMEIGGGFGSLGEVLKYSGIEGQKYIDIDIPPMSFISWKYLSSVYSEKDIKYFMDYIKVDKIEISELPKCTILNSWQIEKLQGKIDLFVNFISFQEMEPNIVINYLNNIKRLKPEWILLRNMREGKQIKKNVEDVGVEVAILKDDYIGMIKDEYNLVESNVNPFGYKTVDGFHSELLLFKRK